MISIIYFAALKVPRLLQMQQMLAVLLVYYQRPCGHQPLAHAREQPNSTPATARMWLVWTRPGGESG